MKKFVSLSPSGGVVEGGRSLHVPTVSALPPVAALGSIALLVPSGVLYLYGPRGWVAQQ